MNVALDRIYYILTVILSQTDVLTKQNMPYTLRTGGTKYYIVPISIMQLVVLNNPVTSVVLLTLCILKQ
jgi:hypothetical protein